MNEEKRIISLLKSYDQSYVRIPFRFEEYRNYSNNDISLKNYRTIFEKINYNKIRYAININGSKNLALSRGKKEADWILPLDGCCCFTKDGWGDLIKNLYSKKHKNFFFIPMYRLWQNTEYFNFEQSKYTKKEPQISLSRECELKFDDRLIYGVDNKVELFKKLGYYDNKKPKREFGYVLRLQSGVKSKSVNNNWFKLYLLRQKGTMLLLNKIEQSSRGKLANWIYYEISLCQLILRKYLFKNM